MAHLSYAVWLECVAFTELNILSQKADCFISFLGFYPQSGELLRCFEGHTMSVSGLQVVGSVLVTSCLDKLIRCYDLVVRNF